MKHTLNIALMGLKSLVLMSTVLLSGYLSYGDELVDINPSGGGAAIDTTKKTGAFTGYVKYYVYFTEKNPSWLNDVKVTIDDYSGNPHTESYSGSLGLPISSSAGLLFVTYRVNGTAKDVRIYVYGQTPSANKTGKARSVTCYVVEEDIRSGASSPYQTKTYKYLIQQRSESTTYTVVFDANGGSGSMSNQTMTRDVSKALTANSFTRSGSTFAGWATSSTGSVKYTDKQSVSNLASAGGTITLYAVWTAVQTTYTVKFDKNGGTGTMSNQTMTRDVSKALTANSFTRSGSTFAGWATTSTGSVKYADKQSVSNLASAGGTITLYAVWTADSDPDPLPSPAVKQDTFILYARIYDKESGKYLEGSDGKLAAFSADGECRGKTGLSQGPNCKLFQMTVGIESSSEKGIKLKYWSSSTGLIEDLGVTYDGSLATRGSIANPEIIKIPAVDECVITLNSGYTWVSSFVQPEDASFASVFKGVSFADEDVIKSSDGSATYYGGVWYPGTPSFVFTAGRAYAVKKSTADSASVTVKGTAAAASVKVGAGWNWIGPTARGAVDLSDVVHSAGFQNDDVISTSAASTTYYGQWYGDITSLVPGVGYKAKFGKAGALSFGEAANVVDDETLLMVADDAKTAPAWKAETQPDTIIGYYTVKNTKTQSAVETTGSLLAAFAADGTCRGVATIGQGPKGKLFQITIGIASSSDKNISFKVWDAASGETYDVNEKIASVAGVEKIGGIAAPTSLTYTMADPVAKYTVTFDLGKYGTRTGGGALTQQIESGKAATAPTVKAADGWIFTGWDKAFTSVTAVMTVKALYEKDLKPDWKAETQPDTIIGYYTVKNTKTQSAVETTGSLLAAFAADGTCRGVATIGQGPKGKLFQITIGIASSADKNISFKAWDAATGETHDINEKIASVAGVEKIGGIGAPATLTYGQIAKTYHTVTFDLGKCGTRTGGGALTQQVESGKAATAPTFDVAAGWVFVEWDRSFDNVTADLTVTAQYKPGEEPEYGPWGDGSGVANADMCAPTYLQDMGVSICGTPISAGDVVAVYRADTGALCGLGKASASDGTVTVVYYAPAGTKIHFAYWKQGTSTDDIVDAPKSTDMTAVKPGSFVTGAKLNITNDIDLTLKLGSSESWHTVSFNVLPEDPSPENVFREVANKIVAVNGSGVQYWMPGKGGSLKTIAIGAGYWVKAKEDNVTWTISGAPASETAIAVKKGWNLIGYTPESAEATAMVLRSAFADGLLKNVTYGISFYPGKLTAMSPGNGYWVYATKDGTLTYDVSGAADDDVVNAVADDETLFPYGPWGDGAGVVNSEMLAPTYLENMTVSVDGAAVAAGDVVAVFRTDTGALCGLGKAEDESGFVTIVCYAPEGTKLHFQVWQSASGVTDPVLLECDEADDLVAPKPGTFNEGLSLAIKTASNDEPDWEKNIVPQPDTVIGYFVVSNAATRTLVEADRSLLGAFGGAEVRGASRIQQGPFGKIYQITIGVASSSETGLALKVWDAGTKMVYDIERSFSAGVERYGSIAAPEVLVINRPSVYSVRFDANGGEGNMEDLTGLVHGAQSRLPQCTFRREDMTFLGWALEANGSVAYCNGDWISDLTDEDGAIVMLYAVWGTKPSGITFDACETEVGKGDMIELVVYGGCDESAASVNVNLAYANAKAADLDLKKATVSGANGTEMSGLKFPLTLTWSSGDTEPKTIVIPTTVGKPTDAAKYLTLSLSDAKGLDLGIMPACIVTIAAGDDYAGTDVYVLPYASNATGGKVSGGGSVKPDGKKSVTLKATANKGYWFAGWYDAFGNWTSGDLSFKVTPDGSEPLPIYEARFVREQPALCGTYNGFARVNLRGMTVVKNADTSADVYGEYAFTAALSTAGKVSGSVTVGGKKVSLKGDAVFDADEGYAMCLVTADEKALFGTANAETLALYVSADGMAELSGWESTDAHAPLGGEECWGMAYRDVSKDKTASAKLAVFAGTYAGAAVQADGGVVPVSIVVDKTGKVKLAGKYGDGTSLTASGSLGGYMDLGEDGKTAELEVVMTPKALGGGAYHLSLVASKYDNDDPTLLLNGYTTTYTENRVAAAADPDSQMAYPYATGCWVPENPDPEFGVLRLASVDEVVNILYAAKNGVVTGLGSAVESGFTVKFDAKTGIFTVNKGKTYSIQGVLGDYDFVCYAAGRINADGSKTSVSVSHELLEMPVEYFPWADESGAPNDDFSLTLGQNFSESMQASVASDGVSLDLTITGLPAGLKYDKTTGLIVGAPTKAGTSTVKVSYKFGSRTITRTTSLVVADKPANLQAGTYSGYINVWLDAANEGRSVSAPFAATIDKNGALTGSITLFGKKATVKASGYEFVDDDYAAYTATVDLKGVDKAWTAVQLPLYVYANQMSDALTDETFGQGHCFAELVAYRNQSKDAAYANRVKAYVGSYVAALTTTRSGSEDGVPYGVTTVSIVVDAKGTAKLAGTFADGSTFSASSALTVFDDEDDACARLAVSVTPKSLAQGSLWLECFFAQDSDDGNAGRLFDCTGRGGRFVRTDDDYTSYDLNASFAYAYSSLVWVDPSAEAESTCLSLASDEGVFDEATFSWKTKAGLCGKEIVGVDKLIAGPKGATFKLDDKTGLFTGTCGTYRIFGAMAAEGWGVGTAIGTDGSVGSVSVGSIDR